MNYQCGQYIKLKTRNAFVEARMTHLQVFSEIVWKQTMKGTLEMPTDKLDGVQHAKTS